MAVLIIGVDATAALVWSQVVLSFGVPFALIPLIWLVRRRDVMGDLAVGPAVMMAAGVIAALIIALNAVLIIRTLGGG
jgi:manganese transport protein